MAIDTIINQKGRNVFCVYVAIGRRKNSTVAALSQILEQKGAMAYTTIVAVQSVRGGRVALDRTVCRLRDGEELMYQGKDVLIVYDDLTKHAQSIARCLCCCAGRRAAEAYPGDVFYLHSRLLERSANFSSMGGSLAAAAGDRDPSGRLLRVHSHQRHFDYRRPDLPDAAALLPRDPPGGQYWALRVPRRPHTDEGDRNRSRDSSSSSSRSMRDLAAFAKLSSDLDKATQNQLMRGRS